MFVLARLHDRACDSDFLREYHHCSGFDHPKEQCVSASEQASRVLHQAVLAR